MEDLQQRLERYDIVDRIAVGGMAEVFLAKVYGVHGFEKTVAIKRILPELALDPEFEERFIAEAKVAVRLSHANIVQVFDFGRFGESLFIAMEFVDGLDLAALLRHMRDEKRMVPLPTAFHIAIEIMRGLDFAHQHGVVHRDVSPSNILLSRAGEVKIADFGIAVAARPHRPGQPGPRKVMGKWRYMSPEQTRGDQLDTRSDVFSAAAVIFEIFTGEKLFPGDDAEVISRNIAEMVIPKASALRSGLPPRLDEILAGPLSRRPSDRPPRPAVILRSLIELSYESSIVATSLDLAETVGLALPPVVGARSAVDDVIRKQLAANESSVARQTAVTDGKPTATGQTESTGLWLHTVGVDGVSRLEHQEPTIVAQPRARRTSAPPFEIAERLQAAAAPAASIDIDRRTEVGAPPPHDDDELLDPPLAADVPVALAAPASVPATVEPPVAARRRWPVAVAAIAVLAGGGAATWWMLHDRATAVLASRDAGVASGSAPTVVAGVLDLATKPDGAEITVNGKPLGLTPKRVDVSSAERLEVRLHKAGFIDYVDNLNVPAGAVIRIAPTLAIAPAILDVSSDPIGASVTLAGRAVGVTPLKLTDVAPANDVVLVIAKPGYTSYEGKISLRAGAPTVVKQSLKAAQRFGLVNISVQDSHGGVSAGNVYVAGKFVGEAPVQGLRLPVGRQQLVLKNTTLGLTKTVTVVVDEKTTNFYLVKYDGS
jgi:serine/threonine protein kinase